MRHLYFLVPKTTLKVGGLIAILKTIEAVQERVCEATIVTYEIREDEHLFLDDLLNVQDDFLENSIFVVSWGPHVTELSKRLFTQNVIYIAYSTGWKIDISSDVPIVAGSKHTQAYWGKKSPNSLIFYLPSVISDSFQNWKIERDIDVLVQKRKSSKYLLDQLIPTLKPHCNVVLLDSWVSDLAEVFNRSKIYLYDSTEHWNRIGASEGFGLPPLEALACGCTVFSSINDGLSDYLDPEFNSYKIRTYSTQYDTERILKVLKEWNQDETFEDYALKYRASYVEERWRVILSEINHFFDCKKIYTADIKEPETKPQNRDTILQKIKRKLKKWLKHLIS